MYFKTPRKCQCFGVCCESSGTQIFYLVDEAFQSIGKGANSVTSMLHHHFSHLGYGERNVVLHMDNCSGQNKNNAVIGYGMWRVLTGLHDSIEFSTMEASGTFMTKSRHSVTHYVPVPVHRQMYRSRRNNNDFKIVPLF
ncbi:hypothetical protein DPMN_144519 [Dreissena polymorpha]|uniref:Uncharacterized protein n=1 Tax=Dreissena polymorpha TaxID=45954 RepID=A0A9D4GF09_DREPO|nr:hypothetical protein DPMN_144519 [Dreissena polymorpha]